MPALPERAGKRRLYAQKLSAGIFCFHTISNLYQVYYPAVLRSLKNIIESGVKAGIMVGMCGEAAADPLLEPLLISWGLEEFSMSAPSILRARKTISQWTKAECDELAEKALACNTAAEVKALLESAAR